MIVLVVVGAMTAWEGFDKGDMGAAGAIAGLACVGGVIALLGSALLGSALLGFGGTIATTFGICLGTDLTTACFCAVL